MDEELRRRLELEHIRLTRKPIEDQVFASDEPITTLRHIFKGVEDTVLEYNAEYVTEPVRGLIAEWKDPDGFLVRDGKGSSIKLQLAADRRSILQVQNSYWENESHCAGRISNSNRSLIGVPSSIVHSVAKTLFSSFLKVLLVTYTIRIFERADII